MDGADRTRDESLEAVGRRLAEVAEAVLRGASPPIGLRLLAGVIGLLPGIIVGAGGTLLAMWVWRLIG